MTAGSVQGLVLKSEDIEKEVADLKAKGVEVKAIDNIPPANLLPFPILMEMD